VDRAEFENLFKPAQITASPKFNSKKKKWFGSNSIWRSERLSHNVIIIWLHFQ
jgi:hypothetical protein